MTDTAAREEAVERVRAYVESWEGFEPSVTISDERDPNSLYLGDLRLLLSGGEGGSVAIASREGRAVIANLATEELLALVLDGDHRRGCQGREYTCSCGYDTRVEREATTLRSALTDPRQPSEAEPTEHKGRARTKGPKLMNRDREAIARIIAGFRAPVAADGPTAHHIWNRALAKADRILALPGEWRDRATRAEAHAERLAGALEAMVAERHFHQAQPTGDGCEFCGKDLRDTIHYSCGETGSTDRARAMLALSAYNSGKVD